MQDLLMPAVCLRNCRSAGMLCSLSAGRAEGHGMSDLPVHIYGPAGLATFVNAALQASDTYLLMPVVVHEYSLAPPDLEGLSAREVLCAAQPPRLLRFYWALSYTYLFSFFCPCLFVEDRYLMRGLGPMTISQQQGQLLLCFDPTRASVLTELHNHSIT